MHNQSQLNILNHFFNALIAPDKVIDAGETKNELDDENDCGILPDCDPEPFGWSRLLNQGIAKEDDGIEETN